MTGNSLFSRLFVYRRREGRTPREDFFHGSICRHVTQAADVKSVDVGIGEGDRHGVFVERKLESGEGKDQLEHYKSIIKKQDHGVSKTLVFITKHPEPSRYLADSECQFVQKRWSDVYNWFRLTTNPTVS